MFSKKICSLLPLSSSVIAGVSLVVGLLLQFAFYEMGLRLKAEDGPIETASVLVWVVALVLGLVRIVRAPSLGWLAGVVMLSWAIMRELDFQTAFTYRSIESLGFYTRPIASLGEKLLAILALLPFALAGLYLLRLLWQSVRGGEFFRSPWAGHLLIAFGLLAVSLGSEKILGLDTIEETCELGLALVGVLVTREAARSSLERRRAASGRA